MKQVVTPKTSLDELIADFGFRRFPGAVSSLRAFMKQHALSESTDFRQLMVGIIIWSSERKAGRWK